MKNNLILLDIFSYSCMNCLRSLEFIRQIDKAYKQHGLNTIILHAHEWEFEKDKKNILHAIKKNKINFPVLIDKNKKTIRKLRIDFWPSQILIRDGKVIYRHIGEGNYKLLEENVIKALNTQTKKIFHKEPKYGKFPTIYCGYKKKGQIKKLKNKLKFGIVYTDGNWNQKHEYIISTKNNSMLTILTRGKLTNIVAQSLNMKPIKINIKLNNKFIKSLTVNKPQLYYIINLSKNKRNKLTLITKPGLAVYSFSFQ